MHKFLACSQLCMCATVCVWFDQYNQHKEARHHGGPDVSTDVVTNLTHREDLTASGDRLRDIKDSTTSVQVSPEAGFSADVGNVHFFGDQTFDK